MRKDRRNNPKETYLFALLVLIAISISSPGSTRGDSASEIDLKVTNSLKMLYDTIPGAKLLSKNAKGLLVFPKIVKFGFLAGTQFGDGALLKEGKPTDYYRLISASFGLQAGLRAFDYVLMFMDDKSLDYLDRSAGWELGSGPGIVVLNKGFAVSATSTTLRKGVYAFIFDHQGVMAGIELQGTKITKFKPKP